MEAHGKLKILQKPHGDLKIRFGAAWRHSVDFLNTIGAA